MYDDQNSIYALECGANAFGLSQLYPKIEFEK
jgi:hypothetical protein